MAQTGYTPLLIYSSSTVSNAPAAGNLTNSTLGSELAINITDGKLFYKDNANAVQVIAWKTTPTTAGGTGLTSYTAGDLLYYATGTTLTKLGIGAANTVLTSSGSAPQWSTNLNIGSLTATSISDSGNLTFTGTGNRITGDFSNATLANRVLFQTSTTNGASVVGVLPNGTGTITQLAAYGGSDPANAQVFRFDNRGGSESRIESTYAGTPSSGTFLPITIFAGGSERARFFTSGGVSIGDTTDPGAGNLRIGTGNLVIGTSAKGIDFSATPGTGTSELFNDYETGVWTPTFSSSSGSFTSITYDSAVTGAKYTKIGNTVYIQGSIRTSAITVGTASGNLLITGLPFSAVTNVTGQDGIASGSVSQSSAWAVNTPSSVQVSSSQITLFHRTTANGASALTQVSDAGTGASANLIRFSCMYLTAEL